jgi:L-aminopeptidase/D-esterase-like protein
MSEQRTTWYAIGHATNQAGRTGCTVIMFDSLVPACVDVRGSAPGTRETDLLGHGKAVAGVDAILLTGGSAFGLAAADGVVRYLSERGRGFPTPTIPIPIVPAAVIYDLGVGQPVYPTAADGYAAAEAAVEAIDGAGAFGAGTGATVAKLGATAASASGIGMATVELADASVTALVVVNAVGDIRDPNTGRWLARSGDWNAFDRGGREMAMSIGSDTPSMQNTTIGAVLVSAAVDRDTLQRCCIAAHDALARCVVPAHTLYDGDTFFAVGQEIGQTSRSTAVSITCAVEVAVETAIVRIFADRT